MAVDANLGKASVAVRATLDQLDGDLSDARGQVDSAVGRMARGAGRAFQTVGKVALGGIGVATGAVTGLAGVLGTLTVDAAPVEGISDAFEGLAESAGYGQDEMLAALQRGSSGMIAQRDLMMSFNKAASLVSTDFATQLPDAMQYLSKVSASTGQDMGFLMDSLVTGVGRLSPMILDNLSIQVSQAEATERAAEMFGVEAAALSKTQVQAGMMNVVLEKLAANTASMPDVTDSAAAKMAQFRATIQDTKDRIGMALLPVLSTLMTIFGAIASRILPPLVGFIEGTLAPAIGRITSVISDFLWMLGSGISPIGALKIALSQLFGPEIAATIMNIVAGVQQFIEQTRAALAPVLSWLSQNVKLQDVLIALGATIASVVLPVLGSIVAAAAPVVGTFLAVVAIVAALRAAWENNFLGIRDIAANVWGWLQTFIPQAITTIRTVVTTVLTAIQTFWATHGAAITANVQAVWNRVLAIFNFFKSQFMTLFQAFRSAFQGDWRGFGEKLREFWDEGWKKIQQIGEQAWNAIKSFFQNTDWGSVGRSILEGIAKGITAGLEIIKNAAKSAAQAALDAAKGFLGIHSPAQVPADEIGEPSGEGIARGFIASIPSIRRAAQQASAQLVSAAQRSLAMPQMVATPQGAGMSNAAFGQGGLPPITIKIDRVANDIDIEMMARKIVREIQRRGA